MTKLTRDARAFAARVKMGHKRLWLIVEGRVHDSQFYDHLLATHGGLDDSYSIRLAETIDIDGVTGGGKDFALAIHDLLENEGLLAQQNHLGQRTIAFAIDRDFEHLAEDLRSTDHIIYTQTMDVESEILLNGDLPVAASVAYSLPRETTRAILPPSRQLALTLADLWRDWITTGAGAICCGVRTDVPFAHRSRINSGGYGDVLSDRSSTFATEVRDKLDTEEAVDKFDAVRERVGQIYGQGDQWTLVKGKWMAGFTWHILDEQLTSHPREQNVRSDTLAKTCLGTIDFHAAWADYYRLRIDAALAA